MERASDPAVQSLSVKLAGEGQNDVPRRRGDDRMEVAIVALDLLQVLTNGLLAGQRAFAQQLSKVGGRCCEHTEFCHHVDGGGVEGKTAALWELLLGSLEISRKRSPIILCCGVPTMTPSAKLLFGWRLSGAVSAPYRRALSLTSKRMKDLWSQMGLRHSLIKKRNKLQSTCS